MVEATGLSSTESRSSSMSSYSYKISSKSTNRLKSYAHLRSLNVRHFEWLKLRDCIVWSQSRHQCHHLHTKFIQIHQTLQKLLRHFFTPISEVYTSAILEWLKTRD
jgi:hypothetical protein